MQPSSLFYAPLDGEPEEDNNESMTSNGNERYSWIFDRMMPYPPDDAKPIEPLTFDKTGNNIKDIDCKACKATFKTRSTYYTHKNRFREQGMCCVCRKKFPNQRRLVQHAKQFSHQNKCCYCGKVKPVEMFKTHIKNCKPRHEYANRKKLTKNNAAQQSEQPKTSKRKRNH